MSDNPSNQIKLQTSDGVVSVEQLAIALRPYMWEESKQAIALLKQELDKLKTQQEENDREARLARDEIIDLETQLNNAVQINIELH